MKDKNAEQRAAKQKHLQSLRNARKKGLKLERDKPSKIPNPTILIVCEGRNTEKTYFEQFKVLSAQIIAVGTGYNTLSLVKATAKMVKKKAFDQVWCVFDDADPKPDNPNQASNYNSAIHLALQKGFKLAYSNQAFEYWILLHLSDHQGGPMSRKDYDKKINQLLKPYGLAYEGKDNKVVTKELFHFLEGREAKSSKTRQQKAIERSRTIYDRWDHANPSTEESSTCVHLLVEELRLYM